MSQPYNQPAQPYRYPQPNGYYAYPQPPQPQVIYVQQHARKSDGKYPPITAIL